MSVSMISIVSSIVGYGTENLPKSANHEDASTQTWTHILICNIFIIHMDANFFNPSVFYLILPLTINQN